MVSHYQSQLADAANAGDGFARGNLEGDIQVPRSPIEDDVVMRCNRHNEPRMSPAHEEAAKALASFFTSAGGLVYVTQEKIAEEAQLSRPLICRLLKELVNVGRFEAHQINTSEGKRGLAYRMPSEDNDWTPTDLGIGRRITVPEFEQLKTLHEQTEAIRFLMAYLPAGVELPNNVLAVVENMSDIPSEDLFHYYKKTGEPITPNTLLSKSVNNALAERPKRPASQEQLNLIIMNQERTGLQDDDILASWPEIDRYSPVPEGLDTSLMTSLQANRTIQWLKRQEDGPVELPPEPQVREQLCTCTEPSNGVPVDVDIDEKAAVTWQATLQQLALELPRTTFDTWLKDTKGFAFDGMDLHVQVPSVFTVAWLEQRLYQTILRALRQSSGEQLDVMFQPTAQVGHCDLHPHGRRAPDMSARDVWEAALAELEMVLGRDIFESCELQETEALDFEGIDLVVQVPRTQAGMLDGPLRTPILEALRRCSGENLGVRLTFLAETPASEDES